ncbi:MAG: hypothetical protein IJ651_04695 [Bacteroidales bacterium]|nr:hypothetical protein [Bacteroidales bacterium]
MKVVNIPSGASLPDLYREYAGDYPKFFKMDTACKLGFLLAEMLVKDDQDRFQPRQDRAVLAFSRHGSLADDRNFADTMADFPSPALFVYTLPNTVTGEIAIRNKYAGETSAFVLETYDPEMILNQIVMTFEDAAVRSVLAVWVDCPTDDAWAARGWLVELEDLLPQEGHHCCDHHGGGCCHHHGGDEGEHHCCHHHEGEEGEHHCCHHHEGEEGEHHCCHHHEEEGGEHHCHCKKNKQE